MTDSSLQVEFCFDTGYGEGILNASREKVRAAFQGVMPESRELRTTHFSPVEATTLKIIISGLSVGGGIVVAEMLKECGKDLWKVVKKLILPKKGQDEKEVRNSHDRIQLEARIGNSSMVLTLSGTDLQSEAMVKEFLTGGPTRLYEKFSAWVESEDAGA